MEELVGNVKITAALAVKTLRVSELCLAVREILVRHKECFFPHSKGGLGQQQVCQRVCGVPIVGGIQNLTKP